MSRQPIKTPPEKPWLAKRGWANGQIVYSDKTSMLVLWAFALLWNLITLPACFFSYAAASVALREGNL